jgi:hypothetical protein
VDSQHFLGLQTGKPTATSSSGRRARYSSPQDVHIAADHEFRNMDSDEDDEEELEATFPQTSLPPTQPVATPKRRLSASSSSSLGRSASDSSLNSTSSTPRPRSDKGGKMPRPTGLTDERRREAAQAMHQEAWERTGGVCIIQPTLHFFL